MPSAPENTAAADRARRRKTVRLVNDLAKSRRARDARVRHAQPGLDRHREHAPRACGRCSSRTSSSHDGAERRHATATSCAAGRSTRRGATCPTPAAGSSTTRSAWRSSSRCEDQPGDEQAGPTSSPCHKGFALPGVRPAGRVAPRHRTGRPAEPRHQLHRLPLGLRLARPQARVPGDDKVNSADRGVNSLRQEPARERLGRQPLRPARPRARQRAQRLRRDRRRRGAA